MRIIEQAKKSLEKKLPFVIYRKPNENLLKAFFLEDTTLYATKQYETPGFVFAPFDSQYPTYIFPKDKSDYQEELILDFDEFLGEENDDLLTFSESDRSEHIDLVKSGIDEILSSNLKKVVLSRREIFHEQIQPILSFLNLFYAYPSAFVYLWYHPKESLWIGASPENLLHIKANKFSTSALASTQPYLGTLDVKWGEKEKQEHQFVVDYIYDQLKEIDKSIRELKISSTYTSKAGNLLHLKADVSGSIDKSNLKQIIELLHPTPAVCGLPKEKAKAFIKNNERYNRGFYTGFLGEIDIKNQSDLYVNIRCMQQLHETIHVYVGGGITSASNPEKEWKETVDKTKTIKKAISLKK